MGDGLQAPPPRRTPGEKGRPAVWLAMAEHFLDTETRPDLPLTALRCLEAGLSPAEARAVWRYEVTPAVGFNLRSVAGEWAGWNETWLLERVAAVRGRWTVRRGPLGWLRYRALAPHLDAYWRSLERFLQLLGERGSREEQGVLARDLAALARHYFDFAPQPLMAPERARAAALCPEPFRYLVAPVVTQAEAGPAEQRLAAALAGAAPQRG